MRDQQPTVSNCRTVMATLVGTGKETILQTAKVCVKARGAQGKLATVVFDSAAERTYVSSSFIKKLKSRPVGQEWLCYQGFGDQDPSVPELKPVHTLEMCDRFGNSHFLEAPEVGQICPPVHRKKLPDEVLAAYSDLDLADHYGQDGTYVIDILVGQDYYWSLIEMKGSIKQGSLVALRSPFGYVISGSWDIKQAPGGAGC